MLRICFIELTSGGDLQKSSLRIVAGPSRVLNPRFHNFSFQKQDSLALTRQPFCFLAYGLSNDQ